MSMPNEHEIEFVGGNANGLKAKYTKPLPHELVFKKSFYVLKEGTNIYEVNPLGPAK